MVLSPGMPPPALGAGSVLSSNVRLVLNRCTSGGSPSVLLKTATNSSPICWDCLSLSTAPYLLKSRTITQVSVFKIAPTFGPETGS